MRRACTIWKRNTTIHCVSGHTWFVAVTSRGIVYSTLSLFVTIILFLLLLHLSYWRLTKKVGWVLLAWYFIFSLFASLYELNVFGLVNPPECLSDY